MTTADKLHIIQHLSKMTQTQLAEKIGVSFVAFNRWIKGKANPHRKKLAVINALYLGYTGQAIVPKTQLEAKKKLILSRSDKTPNLLRILIERPDLRDEFVLKLTYNSNSIEGSTLSEHDTAAILFDNRVLPHKSLREQMEAKNHQAAWEFLLNHLESRGKLDENLILRLHTMVMNGILPEAGFYRRHGVRIVGSYVPTANYLKIPTLMETLVFDIQKPRKDIVAHVSAIHSRLEQIHPFADGNGRVGRLLMQAMLLKKGIAPANIRQELKSFYYLALKKAQTENDPSQLEDFVCDAILEGFEMMEAS